MLITEPVSGYDLAQRLSELASQGALVVSLDVGQTNAQWLIRYHVDEQPTPEAPEQRELL